MFASFVQKIIYFDVVIHYIIEIVMFTYSCHDPYLLTYSIKIIRLFLSSIPCRNSKTFVVLMYYEITFNVIVNRLCFLSPWNCSETNRKIYDLCRQPIQLTINLLKFFCTDLLSWIQLLCWFSLIFLVVLLAINPINMCIILSFVTTCTLFLVRLSCINNCFI